MTINNFCEKFLAIQNIEDAIKRPDYLNFSYHSSPDAKLENEFELPDCLKSIKDDYQNIKVIFFYIFFFK